MINLKDNCFEPECPLEFTRVPVVAPNGCLKYQLQLTCPQTLTFSNGSGLVGKNLTYVIPVKFSDSDGCVYEIAEPDLDEIMIQGGNCDPIIPTLIKLKFSEVYYLNIAVTLEMLIDCDLVIDISKLNFDLVSVSGPKKGPFCSEKHQMKCCSGANCSWMWTVTVTVPDFECDDPCICESSNGGGHQEYKCHHGEKTKSECGLNPNKNQHGDSGCECSLSLYGDRSMPKMNIRKHFGNLEYLYGSKVYT